MLRITIVLLAFAFFMQSSVDGRPSDDLNEQNANGQPPHDDGMFTPSTNLTREDNNDNEEIASALESARKHNRHPAEFVIDNKYVLWTGNDKDGAATGAVDHRRQKRSYISYCCYSCGCCYWCCYRC